MWEFSEFENSARLRGQLEDTAGFVVIGKEDSVIYVL